MPRAKAMEIIGTFVFFIGLLFSLIAYSTNAWIKVDMPGSGKENPVYEAAYPNFAELTVGFSGFCITGKQKIQHLDARVCSAYDTGTKVNGIPVMAILTSTQLPDGVSCYCDYHHYNAAQKADFDAEDVLYEANTDNLADDCTRKYRPHTHCEYSHDGDWEAVQDNDCVTNAQLNARITNKDPNEVTTCADFSTSFMQDYSSGVSMYGNWPGGYGGYGWGGYGGRGMISNAFGSFNPNDQGSFAGVYLNVDMFAGPLTYLMFSPAQLNSWYATTFHGSLPNPFLQQPYCSTSTKRANGEIISKPCNGYKYLRNLIISAIAFQLLGAVLLIAALNGRLPKRKGMLAKIQLVVLFIAVIQIWVAVGITYDAFVTDEEHASLDSAYTKYGFYGFDKSTEVQIGYSAILAIFAGIFVLVGSIMFFVANLNPSKTLEVSAVDAQQNSELDKHAIAIAKLQQSPLKRQVNLPVLAPTQGSTSNNNEYT